MSASAVHTEKEHSTEGNEQDRPGLVESSRIRVKQRPNISSNRYNLILFFAVALFYCLWVIRTYGFSLTNETGDASELWKTITTWGTSEVHYSYVLYKGIFSIQPYLWLYRIATVLRLPDQSLVIVFFGLLYAYSSVYGFPAVISQLMGRDKAVKTWKRALFAIVFFQLTKYTYAYSELMVDLPSMAAFLMLIHLAIRLPETGGHFKCGLQDYVKFLATGLCAGVCLCLSGQYTLAAYCVIVFVLIKLVHLARASFPRTGKYAGIGTLLFIAGAASVVAVNTRFSAAVMEEVAASGAFCPSGIWWMERALYRNLQYYQYFGIYIPNHRLTQVAYKIYGETEAIRRFTDAEIAASTDSFWAISDYLGTALKYPVDFISSWLNHFLYTISMDQWHQCGTALLVSYSSLYITLFGFVTCVKKWGDIFNRNFWIVLGFLCVAIPIMVLGIEPRYTISVAGLFLGYTICGDMFWRPLAGFFQGVRNIVQSRSLSCLRDQKVPMAFLLWIVFIVAAFSWYAALMENCGTSVDILFHW